MAEDTKILTDGYGLIIDYLRISLTDRCNLRCRYCMPRAGINALKHEEILTLEEVYRIAGVMSDMGIRRIRLTGGEPLVRKNMLSLVKKLGELKDKPRLCLTTNGVLLNEYLEEFCKAGLTDINISLDTKDPVIFKDLTGTDALESVERSISGALEMKMQLKLNCVLLRGVNDNEADKLAGMAKEMPPDVRFIELMPIGCAGMFRGISREELLEKLTKAYGPYEVLQDESGTLRGPAEYVKFRGFKGRVGFISPLSHTFCESCNRVRLTADGKLKLCLFYPDAAALLPMLRNGCSDAELRAAILKAVKNKPQRHAFGRPDEPKKAKEERNMNQIGG